MFQINVPTSQIKHLFSIRYFVESIFTDIHFQASMMPQNTFISSVLMILESPFQYLRAHLHHSLLSAFILKMMTG